VTDREKKMNKLAEHIIDAINRKDNLKGDEESE